MRYQVADPKTYSVVAALHNAGLFRRGMTLVGSHAYGVLLNTLGIAAGLYQSFNVDVARGAALGSDAPTPGFAELLAQTGLKVVEVPAFHPGDPFDVI
ncbi:MULTISPECIES: GSU2403 family nucleotidyltransferase fold protein [unclassified Achromobacter]|uniref:GSU2403 family nucleotidyltransferase fold protein n=1 Tax=Achromobacter sp. HZ28 TaxID=2015171 RepID=UPI001303B9B0|nr:MULTISPECIES: GSU2403 family nucleotidyltransferase fold protein [unclassified Achromobacter]